MPTTSLFAVGTDLIEIGRFGMGLEDARKKFLLMAEGHGLKPVKIEFKHGRLTFSFCDSEILPTGLFTFI